MIKLWQKEQLKNFIAFYYKALESLPQNQNLKEFVEIFKDEASIKAWLESFDNVRYQELLMHNLALQADIYKFEKLIEEDIDISTQLMGGSNIIHSAVLGRNLDIIKLLQDRFKDIDLDLAKEERGTPFCMAAQYSRLDIVKHLLAYKVNKEVTDLDGNNTIMIEDAKNNLEMVKLLYSAGVNIHSKNTIVLNALMITAQHSHINIIEYLLFKGADISSIDVHKANALFLSVMKGDIKTTKFLISNKIDVNLKSKLNMTVLGIACFEKNIKIVKLLLAAGANPSLPLAGKESIVDAPFLIEKIILEIKAFKKDPVKYILKSNKEAKIALTALHNLEESLSLSSENIWLNKIQYTEACLTQVENLGQDLSLICGEHKSHEMEF